MYINQFTPWKKGYFIFQSASIDKRIIARTALDSSDDEELAVSMRQLISVRIIDDAIAKMKLSARHNKG